MKIESINKKQIIITVGSVFICLLIVLVGVYQSRGKKITLYDKDNKEFATVHFLDGKFQYQCEDSDLSYAEVVMDEAISVFEKGTFKEELKIYTYYDAGISQQIQQAFLNYKEDQYGECGVFMDTMGKVIACYSNSGDDTNHVLAQRYVASTIKPLTVYGPSIEKKQICWSSMFEDTPIKQIKSENGTDIDWPQSRGYTGEMKTVQDEVAISGNATALRVLGRLNMEEHLDFLSDKMGFHLEPEKKMLQEEGEDSILSHIALGYLVEGESVLDMTGRYQIFANGGRYQAPYTIRQMKVNDKEAYHHQDNYTGVFSEETAYIVNRMLKTVAEKGGTGEEAYIEAMDVCGKTGTTEGSRDNWFIGMTPDYICGVWYGRAEARGDKKNDAPRIFREIMARHGEEKEKQFIIPDEVIEKDYCTKSGELASGGCSETRRGYYAIDVMPGTCDQCN